MTEQEVENKLIINEKTAPRLTPQDIDSNIVDTAIVKFTSKGGQILRWAVLTTKNGFAVTGKPSASVSAENDHPEIGEEIAIANARSELWPLMGYELKSKLASHEAAEFIAATGD